MATKVFVDYWGASWCAPCAVAKPSFQIASNFFYDNENVSLSIKDYDADRAEYPTGVPTALPCIIYYVGEVAEFKEYTNGESSENIKARVNAWLANTNQAPTAPPPPTGPYHPLPLPPPPPSIATDRKSVV